MDKNILDCRVEEGVEHLKKSDNVMSFLIEKHGQCQILKNKGDLFCTLIRSIISQQLSAKTSLAIENRLKVAVGLYDPRVFLTTKEGIFRSAGISTAKVKYIIELSKRIAHGHLNLEHLNDKNDEEVIAILTEVPGIGRWTAEMFLIFGLYRTDVLSKSDAGIKRAARMLYGENLDLDRISNKWKPYRSIASWYLWKHIDS